MTGGPGMRFLHTMQTNGTLLDDAVGAFLKEHNFLIGISIDGPAELHDVYRRGQGRQPDLRPGDARPAPAAEARRRVQHPRTVNRANGDHPLEVYRFLRDEAGADWIQFIPVVERISAGGRPHQEGTASRPRACCRSSSAVS